MRTDASLDKKGPLKFSIRTGAQLLANTGVLTVKSTIKIDVDANTEPELRCIWRADGTTVEWISSKCYLHRTADADENRIYIRAPRDNNIEAATTYHVTVTTINSDGNQGLEWKGGEGDYGLDFRCYSDAAMTTNLNRSDRKYISLIPKDFAKGIVYADHGTVGYFSRYRFHLSLPAGQGLVKSLDGGRIVVEFPISTSFDVYFDADLGNPLNWSANGDNSRFPCQNIGLKFLFTTVTYQRIQCWMEKGDPTQDNWTRIIIDNFDQLNAGETDIMFDFPMVKNPT